MTLPLLAPPRILMRICTQSVSASIITLTVCRPYRDAQVASYCTQQWPMPQICIHLALWAMYPPSFRECSCYHVLRSWRMKYYAVGRHYDNRPITARIVALALPVSFLAQPRALWSDRKPDAESSCVFSQAEDEVCSSEGATRWRYHRTSVTVALWATCKVD